MKNASKNATTIVLGLVAIALPLGLARWLGRSEPQPPPVRGGEPSASALPARPTRTGTDDAPTAQAPSASARSDPGQKARAKRDALRNAIREARATKRRSDDDNGDGEAHEQALPAADADTDADRWRARIDGDELDPDYIQARLEEDMIPGARHCFNRLLVDNPGYSGTVIMKFSIVADEELGGVVEEVSLGESAGIKDEGMRSCLEDAMYELMFDPPEAGGSVQVEYPLEFEPGE